MVAAVFNVPTPPPRRTSSPRFKDVGRRERRRETLASKHRRNLRPDVLETRELHKIPVALANNLKPDADPVRKIRPHFIFGRADMDSVQLLPTNLFFTLH